MIKILFQLTGHNPKHGKLLIKLICTRVLSLENGR